MSNAFIPTTIGDRDFRSSLREYLARYDQIPFRVLYGGGDFPFNPALWSHSQTRNLDLTIDDARANGITIAFYCSFAEDATYEVQSSPEGFFRAETSVSIDSLSPDLALPPDVITLEAANTTLELRDRTICTRSNIGRAEYDTFNWSGLLDQAIRLTSHPELRDEAIQEIRSQSLDRYIEAMDNRGPAMLASVRAELDEDMARLHEERSRYRRTEATVAAKRLQVDAAIDAMDSPDHDALRAEWSALERNQHVDAAIVTQNRLVITTHQLTLTNPETGATAPLGKFRLTIPIDRAGFEWQITNLNGRRGNFDHPHVHQGHLCAGELSESIYELGNRQQFVTAANMIISLLQTATPEDDWGRHIRWWFEESEDAPQPPGELDA